MRALKHVAGVMAFSGDVSQVVSEEAEQKKGKQPAGWLAAAREATS